MFWISHRILRPALSALCVFGFSCAVGPQYFPQSIESTPPERLAKICFSRIPVLKTVDGTPANTRIWMTPGGQLYEYYIEPGKHTIEYYAYTPVIEARTKFYQEYACTAEIDLKEPGLYRDLDATVARVIDRVSTGEKLTYPEFHWRFPYHVHEEKLRLQRKEAREAEERRVRREAAREINEGKFALIRSYQPNVTSLEEFRRSPGWSLASPAKATIGIVGIQKKGSWVSYEIGILSDGKQRFALSIGNTKVERSTDDVLGNEEFLREADRAYLYFELSKDDAKLWFKEKEVVATLTFDNGKLISCTIRE